jgi:hypothetical protein
VVLNLTYGFEGTGKPLGDFQFSSQKLQGDGHENLSNRFARQWVGRLPTPVPEYYIVGIDLVILDFERPSRPSYLRGKFANHGWWYYYAYGFAVKETLGLWTLAGLALFAVFFRRGYSATWQRELAVLAPAIAVFLLVSSQSSFSRHLRYALPALPFVFIWIGKLGIAWERGHHKLAWGSLAAAVGAALSSLAVYPHSLSYFNEFAGGPRSGAFHMSNSNIDWGQDLFYLKRWLERRPDSEPLFLAYYGVVDPNLAGIGFRLPPSSTDVPKLERGWYAISVNHLQGYPFPLPDETGHWRQQPMYAYSYFQQLEPDTTVGYSIYLYHANEQ